MQKKTSTAHAAQRARWTWATAVTLGLIYVGSTLLTPLYAIYRREFGFSELVVTEIYAVYVVGNLLVLFVFGRLSDQIGRRRTTLIALGGTVLSALCFLCATGTGWLFGARVVNGFAAGLGAGALTAWIAELEPHEDRMRAAVLASGGNLAGLAFGAAVAGVLAQYAPWPLRTSFVVFLVLLVVMATVLRSAPEPIEHAATRLCQLSLRPRIGVPRGIRLAFVAPAAMAFAAFALGGFYAALAPGLIAQSLHEHNLAVVGGVVALFFGAACAAAVVTRTLKSRSAMLCALVLMMIGLLLLVLAEALQSMGALLVASVIAGAAMALGYRGSLQIINEIAPEDRRAEVVSSYLLVCYTANSLPVVGVGLLSQIVSPAAAHRVFAAVLAMLATIACAVGLRYSADKKT